MVSFLRRDKTTVGLDIGSGFVKVAVVDHSGPQPELVHVSQSPLLSDAIVEGEIMDPQIVSETLRSLLASRASSRSGWWPRWAGAT
jgi:type IV pilus assembly protein PilM